MAAHLEDLVQAIEKLDINKFRVAHNQYYEHPSNDEKPYILQYFEVVCQTTTELVIEREIRLSDSAQEKLKTLLALYNQIKDRAVRNKLVTLQSVIDLQLRWDEPPGEAIGNEFPEEAIGNEFPREAIGNEFPGEAIGNEFPEEAIGNEPPGEVIMLSIESLYQEVLNVVKNNNILDIKKIELIIVLYRKFKEDIISLFKNTLKTGSFVVNNVLIAYEHANNYIEKCFTEVSEKIRLEVGAAYPLMTTITGYISVLEINLYISDENIKKKVLSILEKMIEREEASYNSLKVECLEKIVELKNLIENDKKYKAVSDMINNFLKPASEANMVDFINELNGKIESINEKQKAKKTYFSFSTKSNQDVAVDEQKITALMGDIVSDSGLYASSLRSVNRMQKILESSRSDSSFAPAIPSGRGRANPQIVVGVHRLPPTFFSSVPSVQPPDQDSQNDYQNEISTSLASQGNSPKK